MPLGKGCLPDGAAKPAGRPRTPAASQLPLGSAPRLPGGGCRGRHRSSPFTPGRPKAARASPVAFLPAAAVQPSPPKPLSWPPRSAAEKGLPGCPCGFALAEKAADVPVTGTSGASGAGKARQGPVFWDCCSVSLRSCRTQLALPSEDRCFQYCGKGRGDPQSKGRKEGVGWESPTGGCPTWGRTSTGSRNQSVSLRCFGAPPPAERRLQSRPGSGRRPGRRCHPSCFCFSAGRCLGVQGCACGLDLSGLAKSP